MSSGHRFVFDTNVLVSALLFENSVPGKAFFAALSGGEILISQPLIKELANVLARPKFDRYVDSKARERFLVELVRKAQLIGITRSIDICRDSTDNMLLEVAVCGGAACIVSGDEDLLVLDPFENIRVLTPIEFLESLVP
ncbi:MAG: putative toxin-antitoxin system toxin component, PIN family [Planctomycetes bacterium]|nr:putative toxin-antitoxin system toxin component, PIN family [Planctomycetota bacterium]